MPIQITCPSCSKQMRAPDSAAGKAARCPGCGQVIQIPQAPTQIVEPTLPAQVVGGTLPSYGHVQPPAKPAANSNKSLLIILGAIAAVGLVLMVCVVAALFLWVARDEVASVAATPNTPPQPTAAPATPPVVSTPPTPATQSRPAAPVAATPAATIAQEPFGWPLAPDAPATTWTGPLAKTDLYAGFGAVFSSAPVPIAGLAFTSQGASSQSWDLATGQQIGAISQETIKAKQRAISVDGKALAMINADRPSWHKVEVWSYETGEQVAVIDVEEAGKQVSSIAMPSPTRLLAFSSNHTGGKFERVLRLFDVGQGTQIGSHTFEEDVNLKHAGLSPSGRYLATVSKKGELSVFETETLRQVAYAKTVHPQFSNLGGIAFSHGGDRIACSWTSINNFTQIVTLDLANGESTVATELVGTQTYSPLTGRIYQGRGLQWLPGDSGWLVSGKAVVDATSGRAVWFVDTVGEFSSSPRWAVPGGVLVHAGRRIQLELKLIPVPMPEAQAAAATVSDATALLKPGTTVAVKVNVVKLQHGSPDATTATLTETLTKRLEADGLVVADADAAVTLTISYSEAAGEMARAMRDRSKTVQTTNAQIKLEWQAGPAPPFRTIEMAVDPTLVRVKEFTPAAYREGMFEKAQKQLASAPFPYLAIGNDVLPGLTLYE